MFQVGFLMLEASHEIFIQNIEEVIWLSTDDPNSYFFGVCLYHTYTNQQVETKAYTIIWFYQATGMLYFFESFLSTVDQKMFEVREKTKLLRL